jgi:hypothetical protein
MNWLLVFLAVSLLTFALWARIGYVLNSDRRPEWEELS